MIFYINININKYINIYDILIQSYFIFLTHFRFISFFFCANIYKLYVEI